MFLQSDKKVLEITEEIETWKMKDKINYEDFEGNWMEKWWLYDAIKD